MGEVTAEVFKTHGDQPWRFRIVASNGEPIAASEGYVNKADARATAAEIVGDEYVKGEAE